jgi:hypothetical protein
VQEQGLIGENIDVIIGFYGQHHETMINFLNKMGMLLFLGVSFFSF